MLNKLKCWLGWHDYKWHYSNVIEGACYASFLCEACKKKKETSFYQRMKFKFNLKLKDILLTVTYPLWRKVICYILGQAYSQCLITSEQFHYLDAAFDRRSKKQMMFKCNGKHKRFFEK